jgi:hypothetical protein
VFAEGERNDVVGAEHFSKTTVVCDESGDDAKVSSNLDNVDLLV